MYLFVSSSLWSTLLSFVFLYHIIHCSLVYTLCLGVAVEAIKTLRLSVAAIFSSFSSHLFFSIFYIITYIWLPITHFFYLYKWSNTLSHITVPTLCLIFESRSFQVKLWALARLRGFLFSNGEQRPGIWGPVYGFGKGRVLKRRFRFSGEYYTLS